VTYLLDTNVISEPRRKQPDAKVISWLGKLDSADAHVSVLTFGEFVKGIVLIARRDAVQAEALRRWFEATRRRYADQTIPIDMDIAELWGQLVAKRPMPTVDGLLAATALVRDLTFVTRDTRDIAGTGVRTFNPWTG
jgi:hypothetical protein